MEPRILGGLYRVSGFQGVLGIGFGFSGLGVQKITHEFIVRVPQVIWL